MPIYDWTFLSRWLRRSPVRVVVRISFLPALVTWFLAKHMVALWLAGCLCLIMGRRKVCGQAEIIKTPKPIASEKHAAAAAAEVQAACPICQEPVGSSSPEGTVESWSFLPCGHCFGSYCIKRYLGIAADEHPLCPVCRQAAYHACGHPVLPVVVSRRHTLADAEAEARARRRMPEHDRSPLLVPCGYCRMPRGSADRLAAKRPGSNSGSGSGTGTGTGTGGRWKAPFRWLFGLVPPARRERRRLQRSRHARERADQTYDGLLWRPTASDGPWIDRFPRYRDPGWERWWRDQVPRGA